MRAARGERTAARHCVVPVLPPLAKQPMGFAYKPCNSHPAAAAATSYRWSRLTPIPLVGPCGHIETNAEESP